jgi:hypothetical protein
MLTLFFQDRPVRTWSDVSRSDTARFGRFFAGIGVISESLGFLD